MKKLMTMIAAVATAFGLYADDTLNNSVDFADYGDVNPWKLTQKDGETTDALWAWAGSAALPATDEAKIESKELVLSTGSNVLSRKFAAEATDIDDGLFVDMVLDYNGEALDTIPTVESGKIAIFALDQTEIEGAPAETNVYVLANYGTEGKALYNLGVFDFDTPRRVALKAYKNVITGEDADARAGFLVYMGAETAQFDKLLPAAAIAVYAFDENDQVVWTDVKGEGPNYLGRSDVMSSKWVKDRKLFISLDTDPQTSGKLASVDFAGRAKLASITLTDDSTDWPADDVRMAVELTDAEITDITGAELMGEELVAEDNGVEVTFKAAPKGKDNVTVDYTGTISGPDEDGVYTITFNEANTLTVTGWNTAATVNGTAYPTIAAAIEAANTAAETAPVNFVLNSAQSGEGENISFSGVEMITLDLNGQTLIVTEEESGYLANTGKLTIFDSDTEKKGNIVGKVGNYGTLVINSGTFNGKVINDFDGETSYGNLMIAGGVFNDKVSNGDDCTAVATAGDFAKFDETEETGMTEAEVKALLPTSGEKTYEVVDGDNYWKVQEKAIVKGTVIFICEATKLCETNEFNVGSAIQWPSVGDTTYVTTTWYDNKALTEPTADTEVKEGETTYYAKGTVEFADYNIDDVADLKRLKAAVAVGMKFEDNTFTLTQDINMSDEVWEGIGDYNGGSTQLPNAFKGTLNGAGFAIKNITFARGEYYGFFNQLQGATISNITFNVAGFAAGAETSYGAGVVANWVTGTTFDHVTVTGTLEGSHNVAGIAIKACGGTTFKDCVNNADITCTGSKRAGGLVGFESSTSGGVHFIRCTNNGNITAKYANSADYAIGGIMAAANGQSITFEDCANYGTVAFSTEMTGAVRKGAFIGWVDNQKITATGSNTMKIIDGLDAIGTLNGTATETGFDYATEITGTQVTFSVLAEDGTFTLMKAGLAPQFTLAAIDDTITFKTNLFEAASFAGIQTSDPATIGLKEEADANGVTFTAVAKQTDPIPPLPDNPTADDVNNAVDKANFADTTVKAMIGGDPAKYAAFKTWADTVTGGQVAVVASTKAAVSYQASAIAEAHLYTNDPEVKIETITLGNSLVATVKVTDGNTVIKAIEAIKDHVKASTDLANWTGASATATINTDTGIATITVEKPGTDKGFIKVLVD